MNQMLSLIVVLNRVIFSLQHLRSFRIASVLCGGKSEVVLLPFTFCFKA